MKIHQQQKKYGTEAMPVQLINNFRYCRKSYICLQINQTHTELSFTSPISYSITNKNLYTRVYFILSIIQLYLCPFEIVLKVSHKVTIIIIISSSVQYLEGFQDTQYQCVTLCTLPQNNVIIIKNMFTT